MRGGGGRQVARVTRGLYIKAFTLKNDINKFTVVIYSKKIASVGDSLN